MEKDKQGVEVLGSFKEDFDKNFLGGWYFPIEHPETTEFVLTIDEMRKNVSVYNPKTKKVDNRRVLYFVEDVPPLVLNKTNQFALEKRFGTDIVEKWKNNKIIIYYDPKVKAGGAVVGGVRIRDFAPKTDEYFCADCGSLITSQNGFDAAVIAETAKTKFGEYLCFDCANKRKGKDGTTTE